jgi:hypothetical protein
MIQRLCAVRLRFVRVRGGCTAHGIQPQAHHHGKTSENTANMPHHSQAAWPPPRARRDRGSSTARHSR